MNEEISKRRNGSNTNLKLITLKVSEKVKSLKKYFLKTNKQTPESGEKKILSLSPFVPAANSVSAQAVTYSSESRAICHFKVFPQVMRASFENESCITEFLHFQMQ